MLLPQFDSVLFDLDGTIINSADGIFNCIEHALDSFGIKPVRETLSKYIGPSLRQTFLDFVPANQVETAINLYRERYKSIGVYECEIYEGMAELLKRLTDNGFKVALATAKPEVFAVQILKHLDIAKYFTFIGGAALDTSRESKAEVIEYVLKSEKMLGCTPIMIGDRDNDMQGAKICNIPAMGVLYGFGSRQELSQFNPLFLAENTKQVGDWLCNHRKRA